MYQKFNEHIGHKITVVNYADGDNLAVECFKCGEILIDANREEESEKIDYDKTSKNTPDNIVELICEEKHTNYQPNGKDWHCPNCKGIPISIYILNSMNDKCEELHNEDEVKCMSCEYITSGKNMAEKLLEKTDLVICPTCDGERMVSHKTIPKNISDDSNEKMLIGKTISNITREIIEQDYGDHTVITLIFTDGTKHGFVLPIDEE